MAMGPCWALISNIMCIKLLCLYIDLSAFTFTHATIRQSWYYCLKERPHHSELKFCRKYFLIWAMFAVRAVIILHYKNFPECLQR